MRILSILLSVLSVAVNVPSGRGLQLGRNPHALIKISLSHSRLRANPVDDLPELQNVAQDTPFAAMSSVLPRLILQTSVGMFLLSAPLGMMLDNYHGKCKIVFIFFRE